MIERIERFVRKYYFNRLVQGVLIGAVLWMVFFLLVNTLEYFSWFSSNIRLVLFILLLAVSAFVLVFFLAVPLVNLIRYRKKMSVETAALMIGRFFPEVQDKLLNTIQLSEAMANDASNALLAAAIDQRTRELSPIRFTDAVNLKDNRRYFWVFLPLVLLLVCLAIFLPHFAVQPTQRIVNYGQTYQKPLPFQVNFVADTLETSQGVDQTFSIQVVGDRIPDAFYVQSTLGRQVFQKLSVNDFSYTFKNPRHDLSFQVVGGEYVSPPLVLKVHPNPALLSYQCQASYPAYIHRSPEVFEGKTRLLVPQGSKLKFLFALRDCDSAFFVKDSLTTAMAVMKDAADYVLVADHSTDFEFFGHNRWSQQFDPLRFTVEVIPDAYPDIRVESYDESLSTVVYYSGLIADDYGFTKLTFNCHIKQPVEKKITLPLVFDRSQNRTSFFHHFDMDSLGILPGQDMEVYFEVWDNDGYHGPKSKRSQVFTYHKPSAAMLDSVADQSEQDILDRMSQRADDATKLRDDIEKMLQELASKKELDWSDKEKLKEMLEKQQQIEEEWNRLQEEQEKLSDFLKEHELANEELLQKQEKINELFEELIPEELKKMMEEIEKLLDEMPRDQMQQMLQNLKNNNQKMQDLLDRNLSLLEQLKMEKELNEFMEQLNQLGEQLQQENDEESMSAEEGQREFEALMQQFDSLQQKNEQLQDPFDLQKDEQLEESIEQDLQEAMDMEQQQNNAGGQQPQGAKQKKKNAGKNMQEMANAMMMQMQMGGMEQMAEDSRLVRILLENVVRASHQQESLMRDLGRMRSDDPSLRQKIVEQKDLTDNFTMIQDSLRAMALRQPAIQNFVFDELKVIDRQTSVALKYMNDLHLPAAVSNQQTALRSMNNLALMLAESLEDMENAMMAMGGGQSCKKPQSGSTGQQMKNMQQLQQQLGEQLKKLQEKMQQQNGGMPSSQLSEELARMAAEQEMIRQGMQQMLKEMKENGQLGDDGLNQIIKDMEKLEEDLVNKRVNKKTIERNREILSRMLESEKAQQKRDQEEKRKSNEYKGSRFDRHVDELLYQQHLKKNQDFLEQNPIQYYPYYKAKINDYYLKKNLN